MGLRWRWVPPLVAIVAVAVAVPFGLAWVLGTTIAVSLGLVVLAVRMMAASRKAVAGRQAQPGRRATPR